LSNYAVSAVHCVKNLYRVIANGIIENFNRVTHPIETNKTVFIAVAIHQTGANSSPKSMDNVFPRYLMFERRRHKYNFRLHAFSIAQKGVINNRIKAKVPYKNNIIFLTAFLLFFPALLSAQTTDEIQTLLQTPAVSYEQAARFVLEAADVKGSYDKTSGQDAMRFAVEKKWLPQKAKAQDAISMERLSLLVMKAFGMKGGLMYSLFNSAHYSYREMVYQDLIQWESDPHMNVSGEEMIFIVNCLLFRTETNPWEFTQEHPALPAEEIRTEENITLPHEDVQ